MSLHDRSAQDGPLAIRLMNIDDEEAPTFPSAALYAVPLLRKGGVRPEQGVMIIGTAGTMGILALQLCKMTGEDVTGVDRTGKLGLLRTMGFVESGQKAGNVVRTI